MKLSEILRGVNTLRITGDPEVRVLGIAYDSRAVLPGYLFVAVRGGRCDGHSFLRSAAEKGAVAVICELEPDQMPPSIRACAVVSDGRKALAVASANFFLRPSESLSVTGITGTNGKTTTSYIIKSILETWGKKTGLIGTIQYMIAGEVFDASHTTPEAPDFQGLLARMREAGCRHVVSEVSSHALAQRRVDGTTFRAGIFTNLTRDHLDFHGTMEEYYSAKERLFTELLAKGAASVINADDAWGRKLAGRIGEGVLTYGIRPGADLMAAKIHNSFDGLRFTLSIRGEIYDVASPLMGLPNVYNLLAAAGATSAIGVPWETILEGIRRAGTVTGRFEKVDAGQKFLSIIDYAHTGDALERLIYTARGLTDGKIITVFGCGGDRDRGKRPEMGSIATRLSDFTVITSDNPRSEDPEAIIKEIIGGATRKNYLVEPDREKAIRRAVLLAGDGDIVLVAGKGHETYQEARGQRSHFNDREVLEQAIRQLISNR